MCVLNLSAMVLVVVWTLSAGLKIVSLSLLKNVFKETFNPIMTLAAN